MTNTKLIQNKSDINIFAIIKQFGLMECWKCGKLRIDDWNDCPYCKAKCNYEIF